KPGHFAAYIDEAAERLMRLYGDKRVGPHFNASPVVIVSYSGGYLSTAYSLQRGGAVYRVKGVILLDSLPGLRHGAISAFCFRPTPIPPATRTRRSRACSRDGAFPMPARCRAR